MFVRCLFNCSEEDATKKIKPKDDKQNNKNAFNNKNRPDNRGGRGGGGGGGGDGSHGVDGKRRWVMPTGTAFFTGNGATAVVAPSAGAGGGSGVQSSTAIVAGSTLTGAGDAPIIRVNRPNEQIEEVRFMCDM